VKKGKDRLSQETQRLSIEIEEELKELLFAKE
jgi:hypothetical protein